MATSGASLGKAIRNARERRGMSQAQLARALSVQQNVLARLEDGGRADPRFSTVAAIAQALGISLDALAFDAGLTANKPDAKALANKVLETTRLATLARVQLADLDATLAQFSAPNKPPKGKRKA